MDIGLCGARLKERYHIPLIISGYGYDLYDLPSRILNGERESGAY